MNEWKPLRTEDAVELLRGFDAPWWIAGGWSLDLFAGEARESGHERDWDVVVPRLDASARAWLADAVALAHPESPYLELV